MIGTVDGPTAAWTLGVIAGAFLVAVSIERLLDLCDARRARSRHPSRTAVDRYASPGDRR